MLVYEVCWSMLWVALTLIYRLRVVGAERVPRSGPVLLIANHQSYLDPPLVGMGNPGRHLNFIARGGLFSAKGFGWLITALNAVPIKENGSDTAAIRTALEQLAAGRAVLIFPEGSRSPDGAVHAFKRGAWVLMTRAKCPVVPVAIEGAFDAWPRGRKPRLWGARVAVEFGAAMSHAELSRLGADEGLALLRSRVESMRQDLRHELRLASGGAYPASGAGG
jgi:1-acyl-sn-glycerol-3-phosphate acyltransferase